MTLPFAISGLDASFIRRQSSIPKIMSPTKAEHLIVLVHGLWGNPKHLDYIANALREKYSEDQLYILAARQNAGSFTYDGIETGGERIALEVERCLEDLEKNGQRIKKLSVVGYSLGGLVARYAIGLLYQRGWFDKLEPANFTTFASPHLGVRTPLLGWHNHIWNVLGARTLSMSGRQLFMIDKFRDTNRPLLSVLADTDSIFLQSLSRFKQRTLYANVVNDKSAVYYTTSISKIDPYVNPEDFKINYLKGWEPVIVDPENPISPKDDEELPAFYKRLANRSRTVASRVPFALFLIVFIPVGTVLFLINAAVQSVRSAKRIKLHEQETGGVFSFPFMIREAGREARETAESVFENMNNAQSQDYLPEDSQEFGEPTSPLLAPKRSAKNVSGLNPEKGADASVGAVDAEAEEEAPEEIQRQLEFPTLALTAAQFEMIKNLDEVGWRKYPVYIHKARHSHAAMIVRMARKSFEEGKLVVKHWLSEFEI